MSINICYLKVKGSFETGNTPVCCPADFRGLGRYHFPGFRVDHDSQTSQFNAPSGQGPELLK